MSPRIPPLDPEERDATAQRLLEGLRSREGNVANLLATVVRHPDLFRRWMAYTGQLIGGALPPRDRELLILRTCWRCDCAYERGAHELLGQAAGLTGDEIRAVEHGPDWPSWSDFDATLLRAADQLHDQHRLDDTIWNALRERYDVPQLIEVPLLVGHYHGLACAAATLDVEVDADARAVIPSRVLDA